MTNAGRLARVRDTIAPNLRRDVRSRRRRTTQQPTARPARRRAMVAKPTATSTRVHWHRHAINSLEMKCVDVVHDTRAPPRSSPTRDGRSPPTAPGAGCYADPIIWRLPCLRRAGFPCQSLFEACHVLADGGFRVAQWEQSRQLDIRLPMLDAQRAGSRPAPHVAPAAGRPSARTRSTPSTGSFSNWMG